MNGSRIQIPAGNLLVAIQRQNPFMTALKDLTDERLICRALACAEVDLRGDGLLELLWNDGSCPSESPEAEATRPDPESQFAAAGRLLRGLAFSRVDRAAPLRSPGALAHYLFLEHSHRRSPTLGLLMLDAGGRWIGSRRLVRGDLETCRVALADVLGPVLRASGRYLLFFQVRTGGWLHLGEAQTRLLDRMRTAARLQGLEVLDFWTLIGPAQWQSHASCLPGGQPLEAVDEAVAAPEVTAAGNGSGLVQDVWTLAAFLEQGRPTLAGLHDAQNVLEGCGGVARLASARLRRLGLSADHVTRLAALLEVGRRLGDLCSTDRPVLREPDATARFLLDRFQGDASPRRGLIHLDAGEAAAPDRRERLDGGGDPDRARLEQGLSPPRADR